MQDRPAYDELLAALERFLSEEIAPHSEGARRFHARVAANVLGILRREREREEEQLVAEWKGLLGLLGRAPRPRGQQALREAVRARSEELCERIRRGDADQGPFREATLDHLRRAVRDKLLVSNPGWLGPGEESEA